jgi:integrase
MPRTPQVRYFASRSAYYCQFHGKQHLLAAGPKDDPHGPTYKAAVERFSRLMHVGEAQRSEDGCAVSAVVARYYFLLEREGRVESLHQARVVLDPAIAAFGGVRVRDLKPVVVNDWLAGQKAWCSSTKHVAVGVLLRALSWAAKEGIVTKNPIAGMSKPEKLARGKEVVLPEALQDLLIGQANRELAKLLRVLRGTGCRPGEAVHADCGHYKRDLGVLLFPWNPPAGEYRWKTGRKTKRDRVVHLTPTLRELVEVEVDSAGGRGRIFRTLKGVPWTPANLAKAMLRLADRKAVRAWCGANGFDSGKIMAYGFRHSFATRMLKANCPVKLLADLMGTSVLMIERNYGHLHDDHAAMQRLFLHFNGAASPASPEPLP